MEISDAICDHDCVALEAWNNGGNGGALAPTTINIRLFGRGFIEVEDQVSLELVKELVENVDINGKRFQVIHFSLKVKSTPTL